jgi:hypothetical protein
VRVLPKKIKELAQSRISTFIESLKNNQEFQTNPYGAQRWLGLVNYMNGEDWSNKLPAMIQYLKANDKTRSLDFIKTFPELEGIYNG